ncbi:MAG TPA: hypothetical protein VKF40_25165 [Burkholderiales bacterium]|nr:hypothetical protein [Burkholderiales bacterium]
MITDEVIDAIAHIEIHRQAMEKDTNRAAACSQALRKLQELLDQERAALQAQGPDAGRAENVEAVAAEIERVKRLASGGGQGGNSRHGRPPRQRQGGAGQMHNRQRNKGRRPMGRRGGER